LMVGTLFSTPVANMKVAMTGLPLDQPHNVPGERQEPHPMGAWEID
jgi:hypothetical protein